MSARKAKAFVAKFEQQVRAEYEQRLSRASRGSDLGRISNAARDAVTGAWVHELSARGLDSDLVKRALEAISSSNQQDALDILKEWITQAASPSAADDDQTEEEGVVDPKVVAEDSTGDDDGGTEDDGADGVAPAVAPAGAPKKIRASIAREKGISIAEVTASIEAGRRAFAKRGTRGR